MKPLAIIGLTMLSLLISSWVKTAEIQGVNLPFVSDVEIQKVVPHADLALPELTELESYIFVYRGDGISGDCITFPAATGGSGSYTYKFELLIDGNYTANYATDFASGFRTQPFKASTRKLCEINDASWSEDHWQAKYSATDSENNTASQYYHIVSAGSPDYISGKGASFQTVKKNQPFDYNIPLIVNAFPLVPFELDEYEVRFREIHDTTASQADSYTDYNHPNYTPLEDYSTHINNYTAYGFTPGNGVAANSYGTNIIFFSNYDIPSTLKLSAAINKTGVYRLTLSAYLIDSGYPEIKLHYITVLENSYPAFVSTQDSIKLVAGFDSTNYTLSNTTDGEGDVTYTLTLSDGNDLPAGLTFNSTTLQLTVTEADLESVEFNLTYSAADEDGDTQTQTFMLVSGNIELSFVDTVNEGVLVDEALDLSVHPGRSISELTLFSINASQPGDLPLTYSLVNDLTDLGLTINATTGTLSGVVSASFSDTDVQINVSDINGDSSLSPIITFVSEALTPSFASNTSIDNQDCVQTKCPASIALPSLETQGNINTSYSLTYANGSALPDALVFSSQPSTLTVASDLDLGNYSLIYSAVDADNETAQLPFSIAVSTNYDIALEAKAYNKNDENKIPLAPGKLVDNFSLFDLDESDFGNGPIVWTATFDEGIGLSIDNATGLFSGTVNSSFTETGFAITVTDADGDTDQTAKLYFVPEAISPSFGADLDTVECVEVAVMCSFTLADVSTAGNIYDSFTLSLSGGDGLPLGLSFNASSRLLTVIPGNLSINTTYAFDYKVEDVDGSNEIRNFNLNLIAYVNPTLPSIANITVINGEIEDIILPEAVNGVENFTYSVLLSNGSVLPNGLSFSSSVRTLSVETASLAAGDSFTLSYSVIDGNNNTDDVNLSVTVLADLSPTITGTGFFADGNKIALEPGSLVTNLSIFRLVNEGNAPAVFTINDGTELLGMTMDPVTGYLNGEVDSDFSSTSFRVKLTDADGDFHIANVRNFVPEARSPVFNSVANDIECYFGSVVCSVQLSDASEGNVLNIFTLSLANDSTLPESISFDVDTLMVSFDPSDLAANTSWPLRYEVTDVDGDSDVSNFTVTVIADTQPVLSNIEDIQVIYGEGSNVVLPAATDGNAPLNYTLRLSNGSVLPEGVSFTAANLSVGIDGSLLASDLEGTVLNLSYQVVDENNDTVSATILLSILEDLTPTLQATSFFVDGTNIALEPGSIVSDLSIFTALGTGNTPSLFSINDGTELLGMTLDASSGYLNGLVDANFSATNFAIQLTDADGDVVENNSYSFIPEARSPVFVSQASDLACYFGNAVCSIKLSNASEGNVLNLFEVTAANGSVLPSNFVLDTQTLDLTFDPSGLAIDTSFGVRYQVVDIDGSSDVSNFTVTVVADTVPSLEQVADIQVIYGEDSSVQLPKATAGNGLLNYSVLQSDNSSLPTGISFNSSSRSFAIDGTAVLSDLNGTELNVSYQVIDTDGDYASVSFTVELVADLAPLLSTEEFYVDGTDIALQPGAVVNDLTLFTVNAQGNAPSVFTINNGTQLLGLTLDTSTGTLSGSIQSDFTNTSIVVQLTDVDGDTVESTEYFIIPQAKSPEFESTVDNLSCFFGNEVCTLQLPNASEGNIEDNFVLGLTNSSTLPSSFSLDAATSILSFDPVGLSVNSTFALHYTVTDIDGDSDSENFTVTVIENTDPAFGVVPNIDIIAGELEDYTLAAAAGGDGEISYSLLQSDESALPSGLVFTEDNLSLQINAGVLASGDSFNLSYTATDADNGTGTATFLVTVLEDLQPSLVVGAFYSTVNASTQQISLEPGGSLEALVLVTASSQGNTPAVFTINGGSGLLGLSINTSTGVLSGVVDTEFTETNFTITLTDADGDEVSSDAFSFVAQALSPGFETEQPDVSCIEGQSNCSYVLPQATVQGNIADSYTLELSNGSVLPELVSFVASTRTLTVDSTLIDSDAQYDMSFAVADADGSSDAFAFTLTLEADSQPTLIPVQAISANVEQLLSVTLPAAVGGNGPLLYSLHLVGSTELPDGVIFNASSLELSVNASLQAADDSYSLLFEVTDQNGDVASTGVVVSILLDPAPLLRSSAQFEGVDSIALAPGSQLVNLSLVSVDSLGSEPSVFTINNASSFLGLTIDPVTGSLSGTLHSNFTSAEISISLTDVDGDVSSISKSLLALDKIPLFQTPAANLSCVFAGTSCSFNLSEASTGNIENSYKVLLVDDSSLPAAFSFDAESLSLVFDPSNLLTNTSYELRYVVEDIDGSISEQLFTIRVSEELSFDVGEQNYLLITEESASVVLPAASFGTGSISHSLTGSLPSGLVFDSKLLLINGTPTSQGNYTVSLLATDSLNASASIDLVFDIQVQKTPELEATGNMSDYGDGSIQLTLSDSSESNGAVQFSFTTNGVSGLPEGISFNASSQMLVWSADVSGQFNITITLSDDDNVDGVEDETSSSFSLTLMAAISLEQALAQSTSIYSFTDGQLSLPQAKGGAGELSYSVQAADSSSLIDGFSFDTNNRVYSGRSSQVGTYDLEYVVTDTSDNSEIFDFQVVITALPAPAFASEFDDQELGVGEVFDWQLPAAGPAILTELTYSLSASPELPSGVEFAAVAQTLEGSFDQVGSYNITYSVANAANITVSQSFTVEVTLVDVSVALTEDILSHHALAIADSTSRTIKARMALAGQDRIALEEDKTRSRSSRFKSANIKSDGLMYSLWTGVYGTSLSQGNDFNWDADVSISQVGFDVSSSQWFAGFASETVASSIDFDYQEVVGSYDLDIGVSTLYGGYKSGQLSFWGASSTGSGGTLDLALEDSNETTSSELSYTALMGGVSYALNSRLAVGGDYILDASLSTDKAEGSAGRLNAYVDWTMASLRNSEGKVWLQPKLNTALRVDSGTAEQIGVDVSLSSVINLSPSFYVDAGIRILALSLAGDLSETSYWLSGHWQSQSTGFAASLSQRLGSSEFDRNRLLDSRLLSEVSTLQSQQLELAGEMSYSWLQSAHSWKLYSRGSGSQEPGWLDSDQAMVSLFGERIGLQWDNPKNKLSLSADYRLNSASDENEQGVQRLGDYFDQEATQLKLNARIDLP